MSSSRGTPTSCAQIRGWTLNWWTGWCCSWTGSTPRYSVTRKPTGSLQIIHDTVLAVIMSLHLNPLNCIWTWNRSTVCRSTGVRSDLSLHVSPLQFRNLSVPTKVRLAELLKHLNVKGEEACHEFYRGLHIHAEDVYSGLPTRVTQRGKNTEQAFSELQTGEKDVVLQIHR